MSALLASAGAIHLAMVPSHWGQWPAEGAAFAAAGWIQLALAVLVAGRLRGDLLLASGAVNVAAVAAWAVTRTVGAPWGPHAGDPESAGLVDGTVVALEGAAVVVAAVLLLRPGLRRPRFPITGPAIAVVPVLLAILTTGVLAAPQARDHAHGGHSGNGGHGGHGEEHAHDEPGDDLGLAALTNGHQHGDGEVPLDLQTQLRLHAQLAATLELIERYPTVADAEEAGYRRAGPFAPGLGTHYTPPRTVIATEDVLAGESLRWPMLIFDGWDPASKLAGFMYLAGSPDREPPEGFHGPNDHWHHHTDVCVVATERGIDAPLGADRSATQDQCDRYGGVLLERTPYMVHVWTVPGYESSRGLFSEVNPALRCPDGTYFMKEIEQLGTSPTLCRDADGAAS